MPQLVDKTVTRDDAEPSLLLDRHGEQLALAAALGFFLVVAATRLNRTGLWADEAWSLAATNDLGMSLRETHGTMGAYYVLLWA